MIPRVSAVPVPAQCVYLYSPHSPGLLSCARLSRVTRSSSLRTGFFTGWLSRLSPGAGQSRTLEREERRDLIRLLTDTLLPSTDNALMYSHPANGFRHRVQKNIIESKKHKYIKRLFTTRDVLNFSKKYKDINEDHRWMITMIRLSSNFPNWFQVSVYSAFIHDKIAFDSLMNGAFNYSIGVSWKPLRNVLSRRKSLEHTMPSLSFNPGSGIKGQESNWKIVLWRIVHDKITR